MKRFVELTLWSLAAGSLVAALTPNEAAAYMGPGGGLALLTTALAMFAAFSVSTMVVLTWPIRAVKGWLRRRREKGKPDEAKDPKEHPAEEQ
jgi:hypothetical protein